MKVAKAIALLGTLAMGGILIYGFTVGDFSGEGSRLLRMPWGQVSLVDVYVGFMLFSGWVVYREKSALRSILWIVGIIILGNFIASLYALIALYRSQGDWKRFWLGNRA
jgi:ABC-type transport system involved in multi-copper enzyme maturation permease subunit